ncbi:MAG: membrane protein insertase YidC [Gammaproteobacteria bacterium]|nr:MAG: membrane protein insertase YidC [Gammaproteobacteria bacterium]
MDNTRLILLISLAFVATLLWEAWQQDYARQAAPAPAAAQAEQPAPQTAESSDIPSPGEASPLPESLPEQAQASTRRLQVQTDVLRLSIDLEGGGISHLELPAYPVSVDRPDEPFVLMDDSDTLHYRHDGGLLSRQTAPNHHSVYRAQRESYRMAAGDEVLEVPLVWEGPDGLRVVKTYRFERGSYLIDVRYEVHNGSSHPWSGRYYAQLSHKAVERKAGLGSIQTFTGAAISSPEKRYEKLGFDDLEEAPLDREITDGWIAMLQHYFVSALLPPRQESDHYYSKKLPDAVYLIGLYGPTVEAPPGGEVTLRHRVYAGPKLQKVLGSIAPGLELTVDYGPLWFLSKPLFWVLDKIHGLVGNWGWAIVIVTLLLKLAFFQLSATSYRSMARMRRVQPRMQALKERYGDDKQAFNQALMKLYKEEKINPLGGCLPILVQIPVFLAFYWMLLETVELRQAPFILWIRDLSAMDPYYVLPILMGVSMYLQQKLNPAPLDPVQQKVMSLLPVVFTFFFAFFPSGLVLYWLVNNILSIAQQWVITRKYGVPNAPAD